ncbi:Unconventional myosin-XVI [Schistosoma japonicum]|nr:Unconventional myosin-XVI [Schistosoma japonicum]
MKCNVPKQTLPLDTYFSFVHSGISPLEIEEARSEPEMKMLSDLKTAHAKRYDLNILDSQGAAPIHVAAACGYCEVGLYLLQSGVNPNSLDADGWTPSHIAACWGELEMIKLLVSHGGDLTIPTPDGRTAFIYEFNLLNIT